MSNTTRERLLDAAEHLFATKGLDGTSIRDVNAEAGLNPAAVHYHFGSKEALVESALSRRSSAFYEPRLRLIEAAEIEGSSDPRRVVEVVIQPFVDLYENTAWGAKYLGFVAALAAAGAPWYELRLRRHQHWERLRALMTGAVPDLSEATLAYRYELIVTMTTTTLARLVVDGSIEQRLDRDRGGVAEELLACGTAILTAPAG